MDSVSIGLDIGSSAIRAAEVEVSQGKRILRRYAQVGIPSGWVVDGEATNIPAVAEAIRRLWSEGGFRSNRVVVGISGPRVFVRQAEVDVMSAEELRTSLKFDSQELIPIPMEDASFDFSILESAEAADPTAAKHTRLLLVAAHRDAVRSTLAVLKAAGLSAVAIDSTAVALLRAVPTADTQPGAGLEVLVSIGAELTTVAVRQEGVPRFIRTLTVGGTRLTSSIANSMHLEMAAAERLKRGVVPTDTSQLAQSRAASALDMRDLAEDVRATIDFFTSQASGAQIDRLLITGGAAQTEGLANAIGGNLPAEVFQVAPFAGLPTDHLPLSAEDVSRASSTSTTAVGLALWPFDSSLIRLSVLPEEVVRARQARRLVKASAVGLGALVGVLALVGAGRVLQTRSAERHARVVQDQVVSLTGDVSRLQSLTAVHNQMLARGQLDVAALKGDIDWVRLLGQLAYVMPPNVHITSFSGARTASGAVTGGSVVSGTMTVGVTGTGDADTAAAWLDALAADKSLSNTVISGIAVEKTNGSSTATFSSNSDLTSSAQSSRSKEVKPGSPPGP